MLMSQDFKSKERERKRQYKVIPPSDTVETVFTKDGKVVHRVVAKSKRVSTITEYQDPNPDKVKLMNIVFPNVGLISIYFFKQDPERLFIGTGEKYDELDAYHIKALWNGILKSAHHKDILGHYTKKAMKKKYEKLKAIIEENKKKK